MSKKLTSSCNDALQVNQNQIILYKQNNTYSSENIKDSILSEPFVEYYSGIPYLEFERIQSFAERTRGIVLPNLKSKYVEIVKVKHHNFMGSDPLGKARQWAEENLIKTYVSHKGTSEEFEYQISKKSIKKYLHPTAINKSDSILVHLSVLKVLPLVIDASIETEIHADYTKVNNVRSVDNPVNSSVLIHRFYGAIELEYKLYRTKITILEYKQPDFKNKSYSFEVTKIELLDESNNSILDLKVAVQNGTSQLSVAKLLQNVEKSYDKGKFLLEESENDSNS